MDHLIKKQIFNLTLGAGQGAFQLQHRISEFHQREILYMLQKVLDEISTEDQVICIDRLEIDLGKLPMKQILQDDWIHLLEAAIRQQLRQLLDAKDTTATLIRRPQPSGIFHQWLFSMQHGHLPWNAGRVDDDWYLNVLEAVATDHRIAEELRSVLAGGGMVLDRIIYQHSPVFLIPLAESLTAEKQARLAVLADELWTIVQWLEKEGWQAMGLTRRKIEIAAWKKILLFIAAPARTIGVAVRVRTEVLLAGIICIFFSQRQMAMVLRAKEITPGLPLLLPVFRQVMESPDEWETGGNETGYFLTDSHRREQGSGSVAGVDDPVAGKGPAARSENKERKDRPHRTDTWDRREQANDAASGRKDKSDPPPKEKRKDSSVVKISGPEDTANKDTLPEGSEYISPTKEGALKSEPGSGQPVTVKESEVHRIAGATSIPKSPAEIIGEQEIFANNAGVILLHPFLHSFFKILGYVEGGKFRTPELHTRALYLVHYLATEDVVAREHDLVVAKILCAWPLDEPVDGAVELTDAELTEAGDLLTAAIARWEILKRTSHAGLREGFLQRRGKLQVKGRDLYLQLETSSIDVLLDHLPWNLSIIKLPWMEYILRTEWR